MLRLYFALGVLALSSAAVPLTAEAKVEPGPTPAQAFDTGQRSFTSSDEIEAMIAKAKATIRPGQANLVQPLLQFAPYRASLEYRQAGADAAVHQSDAEFFYILKGGGNLIEGGKLSNPAPGDGPNTKTL